MPSSTSASRPFDGRAWNGPAAGSGELPTIPVSELLGDSMNVNIWFAKGRDGHVSLLELLVIISLTKKRRPKALFELGTFDGRTAVNMAANAPQSIVYTLNIDEAARTTKFPLEPDELKYTLEHASLIDRCPDARNIRQLRGDSAVFDFTPYRNSIDLCFVDGSHAYKYVRSDSANAFSITAPQGIILWHDYLHWEGVTKALEELYEGNEEFRGLRHIAGTSLVVLEKHTAPSASGPSVWIPDEAVHEPRHPIDPSIAKRLLGRSLTGDSVFVLTPCARLYDKLRDLAEARTADLRVSYWQDGCWWRNSRIENRGGQSYNLVHSPPGMGVRDAIHFLGPSMRGILFLGTFGSLRSTDTIGDFHLATCERDRSQDGVMETRPRDGISHVRIETVRCFAEETPERIAAALASGVEGFDLELAHLQEEARSRRIPCAAVLSVADLPGRTPFWAVSKTESDALHQSQERLCQSVLDTLSSIDPADPFDLAHSIFRRSK